MMDVSSMYGNHHHHSSNFHNATTNDLNTMQTATAAAAAAAAAAARNGYTNAYFPVSGSAMQHTQSAYTQHMHQLNYGTYNGATPQYYHQQHQQQQQQQSQQTVQHLQQQEKTHATPPLVIQQQQQQHQQHQNHTQQQQQHPTYSHSHLFSPSAAEYGIVSSCTNGTNASGNTPQHAPSHSPSESYYESDSMNSYYATAAVATVTSSTNSPIAAQSSTPTIPTIISSENGLSYTNLDCLYNQNPNHQSHLQQQYEYGTIIGNCINAEEKYANVLNESFGGTAGLMDETALTIENSKQAASSHLWHHHHHHHHHQQQNLNATTFNTNLSNDTINMQAIHTNLTNAQANLCDEMVTNHNSSNCMTSRSQQVISPDGSTSQSNTGQSKSPNQSNSNLPTYKWMQLKRNVPKPQRK